MTTAGGSPDPAHSSSQAALAALYDSRRSLRPVVTYAFLGLCLAVTVPTLFRPELYDLFGGIESRAHPWQLFTAVFEHGWPGFHGGVHLALNVFLILECGRPCERLLGHARFLALSLLSMGANAVLQTVSGGVNGSSLVIWSWGPPLYLALRWARQQDPRAAASSSYARLRGILLLMYVAITAAMTALPYASGWRGNPLRAFLLGNQYHLVATAVGGLAAWAYAGPIRRRLAQLEDDRRRPRDE